MRELCCACGQRTSVFSDVSHHHLRHHSTATITGISDSVSSRGIQTNSDIFGQQYPSVQYSISSQSASSDSQINFEKHNVNRIKAAANMRQLYKHDAHWEHLIN